MPRRENRMSDVQSMDASEDESPRRAIRLVFEYEGEEVRLVSQTHIEKVLPPSDQSADALDSRGTWSEVRDADGATLDRRVLVDPMPRDAEVFPEQLGEEISREPLERPSGVFTLLVPDLEGADHVAVLSNSPGQTGVRAADTGPTELIRVTLTAGGRGSDDHQ
jgi:hypothetical protein